LAKAELSESIATRLAPIFFAQSPPALPCASSSGITRPKVRASLACSYTGSSSEPANGLVSSTALDAGDTWSSLASLVIGSEVRVAPDSKSPM